VSHAYEVQSEVAAVANPRDPRDLMAGSNDERYETRVYESRDGGRTWSSEPAEPFHRGNGCGRGDPALAADSSGRFYYALLVQRNCFASTIRLYVAARDPGATRWRATPVVARGPGSDDKPAIAVDRRSGRVYVAWTRIRDDGERVLISHSDDAGRSWSPPVPVAGFDTASIAALAVGRRGDVYLAFGDYGDGTIWIGRSRNGGRSFTVRAVEQYTVGRPVGCGETLSGIPIPAQPKRCVQPDPALATTPDGRVLLTWNDEDTGATESVWFTAYSPALRVLVRPHRLAPYRQTSDRFFAALAVDPSGDPVVCFYDTAGDPKRVHTWFTCTASRNGGATWQPPVRAASVPSDETQESDPNNYGDYESLVVAGGAAHPVWTDARDLPLYEEVFTATIPLTRLGLPNAP
jgi:hypothetical protein